MAPEQKISEFQPEILEKFRAAVQEIKNLTSPMEDDYLLRFLRAGNFNIPEAITLLEKYYKLKLIFDNMSDVRISEYRHIYEKQIVVMLKNRDSQGRKLILFRAKLWNTKEISFDFICMATYFILHEESTNPETQKNGIVFVLDCEGISITIFKDYLLLLSPSRVKKLSQAHSNYPTKCKAIHVVNAPKFANVFYNTMKYLCTKKMRERFHIHGKGWDSFHKYADPNLLPTCLGGHQSDTDAEDAQLVESLYKNEDYYYGHWKFGYQDRKCLN